MMRKYVRKTKIVCTVGPASARREVMREIILEGMDVARLNFSHGTHEDHARTISLIREISLETGRRVALLQDLCGPKIRVGEIPGGPVTLKKGDLFVITSEERKGDASGAHISYPNLASEVTKGARILIDDGLLELAVEEVSPPSITCQVVTGGPLSSRKGVNFPDVSLKTPSLTEKDKEDLLFGIAQGIDFVALSFVRRAEDVLALKDLLRLQGASIPVIAKIEMAEALGRLEEIIEVSDGIMVARGDLGVETPFEELPHWQKKMIALGRLRGKPVITATQMLDSMIRNPRPTRAEVADVANAIIDGTDAVMLSGESASGAYPVEAVRAMAKIAMAAEQDLPYGAITKAEVSGPGVLDSISLSACEMAEELDAAAIIVATSSGRSARATALYRPQAPIIALTESEEAARRLNLTWGVFPLVMAGGTDTDTFIGQAKTTLLKSGLVREGDLVILSASYPAGMRGSTNTLQIQVLGRTFLRGRGAGTPGEVEGMLVYADAPVEGKCREMGCILALGRLEALDASMLEGVAGVVVEDENITTKDDALLKRMGIPALVGVAGLSGAGRVGERVKLDTCRGIYVQCPDG